MLITSAKTRSSPVFNRSLILAVSLQLWNAIVFCSWGALRLRHLSGSEVMEETRCDAPLDESSLHGAAREGKCRVEVLVCDLRPSAAQLEFAERRGIERISGEAIEAFHGADLFEPAFRVPILGDGNSAVECNHG